MSYTTWFQLHIPTRKYVNNPKTLESIFNIDINIFTDLESSPAVFAALSSSQSFVLPNNVGQKNHDEFLKPLTFMNWKPLALIRKDSWRKRFESEAEIW